MVAVGNTKNPGPIQHWPNSQGFGPQMQMAVRWPPRSGRNRLFALWEDALNDMLAHLRLKRATMHEQPPEKPTGSALSGESYALWVSAVDQFQAEGTAIFDAVRPSLDLDGPHCEMDLNRIAKWKRDGIKDGRALLRWLHSFVDRSTIEGQMKLTIDINGMAVSVDDTLLGLSEHLYNLWEMWLALSSSDRNLPNSFFSILLISMPTVPECPLVHVRRFLVDLIGQGQSQLLKDIDGDDGLFAKMIEYARQLGMKDAPRPDGVNAPRPTDTWEHTASGGRKLNAAGERAMLNYQAPKAGDTPAGGGQTKVKNECCYSFACTPTARGSGGCICKHTSKFDLAGITSKGRREYIKLLREYSKANPSKSLKVAIKLVREAVGDTKPAGKQGIAFMTSVESVLGSDVNNVDELDAWLQDHTGDASFFALGSTEGAGSLQFVVEEVQTEADDQLMAMASSSGSSATLGSSAHSSTEAEVAILQLRAALEDSNAKVRLLETASAATALNAPVPTAPTLEVAAVVPNSSLDAPPPLSALSQMTPKQAYRRLQESWLPTPTPFSSMRRQPLFTPTSVSIPEETVASAGGVNNNNLSSSELMGRSIVAAESEKRKLETKLKKQMSSKYWLMRTMASILLSTGGCARSMVETVGEYCSELTLHQLMTLCLLIYSSYGKVSPVIKLLVSKLSSMMLNASVIQASSLLQHARSTASALLVSLMAKVMLATNKVFGPQTLQSATTSSASVSVQAALVPQATPVSMSMSAAPVAHSAPPAPSDASDGGLFMMSTQLGSAVMLASMELNDMDGVVPALMDNGASNGTSCSRTLDGAVPGTFCASDAGNIGLGSEGAVLESKGSWLYVLHRHGTDSCELVVRRLKYTPNLPMAIVFSEASENMTHGYSIMWKAGEQRVMESPEGLVIRLHMSKSKLGYLKVKPETDPQVQKDMVAAVPKFDGVIAQKSVRQQLVSSGINVLHPSGINVMDPSQVRGVGMKAKPLKGVALLRRRHCTDGHPALTITVKNLMLEGAFDKKLLTLEHVKLFAEQGCGACETAKMRRRPFTLKVAPLDKTLPNLGKVYVFDVLELRVPSFHDGATLVYIAIEKVSSMAFAGTMHGYAEEHMVAALNEIRARVRPVHGEIEILRMDSHPTHRSKGVRDYLIENQLRRQLSPPYVHEGVGAAENYFLHQVPSANAVLMAAPDLNENHWAQAFFFVLHAKNYSVNTKTPDMSPAMVYYSTKDFLGSGLLAFGAESKALVHGEARGSKFENHAKPCIYVGPPIYSDSAAHCGVFYDKSYLDVDLGCIAVDENQVIERTRRGNVTTQPYNQVGGAKTVDIGKPTSLFDLSGMEYNDKDLPKCHPVIWVRGMTMPTEFIVLLLFHGDLRPGDMCSWAYELGATKVVPLPIDLKVGGQEHNLERKPVKMAILEAFKLDNTLGAFMQPECSPYSASRYLQPGPPVLFDVDNPDGIPDEDGEYPSEVTMALNAVSFVAEIFRASAGTNKAVGIEYPASQASHSPFSAKGREKHSTIADTSIVRAVISELGLIVIYTEQGASGAASRKPTSILATPGFAFTLRRTVGTLAMAPGSLANVKITGTDSDGNYKSRGSEIYTPIFALRLTIAFLGAMPALLEELARHDVDSAAKVSTDDIYPIGTRIEVYWYLDKTWYEGMVIDTCVRKGKVHGKSIDRREVHVRYYSDGVQLWHAISDYNMRESVNDENDIDEGNLAVLSMLLERRPTTLVSMGNGDFLSNLFVLDDSELNAGVKPPPPPPPPLKIVLNAPATSTWAAATKAKTDELTQQGVYGTEAAAKGRSPSIVVLKLVPMFIVRKFSEPLEHLDNDLVSKCGSADECARKIAYFLLSMQRVMTKHARMHDESSACNAEPRVDELVRQLKAFTNHGPELVFDAYNAEIAKCKHTPRDMLDMKLDKQRSGRCSECRLKCDSLSGCLVCGQVLCNQCLPQGYHGACLALPEQVTADELKTKKYYCVECGTANTTWCSECMRGACCQPNQACSTCRAPTPPPVPAQAPTQVSPTTNNLDEELFRSSMREAKRSRKDLSVLKPHAGDVFIARDMQIDMLTMEMVENSAVFVVLDNLNVERVATDGAHTWHVPANEREYNASPQRALWRTAKELKMDDYDKVHMYDLVLKSSVDLKVHVIYQTLWAYKIKFKEGGLVFDKLNPRWCVKGGTMDRHTFKSYAEMMRQASLNILWGIKSAYYHKLAAALVDLKDAFQSTGTVDESGKLKEGEHEFYTEQAPGFKKYGPNGEELVCRQRCYMQGRIDATAGFDRRLMEILTKSADFHPLLWDAKVLQYHRTSYTGTTASLTEIIDEGDSIVADGNDSEPQQKPKGWAVIGQHVDDMLALATGVKNHEENRIIRFVKGEIAQVYACKLTGWHGNKILGFDMALDDELETVTVTAQGALETIRKKLLTDDCFKTTPRHIVTEGVYENSPGEVPVVGDPARDAYLERQALSRSCLGGGIWIALAYAQVCSGINSMCMNMASPSDQRLGQLRHMFMFLGPNPPGKTFGGPNVTSIICVGDEVKPFTEGAKEGCYHFFSDASINVTGGIGMFAGCCIQNLCLRQHLQSPCAHTSEIVAGGTNVHAIIPVNGVLQELHIRLGRASTTYFDSASTIFCATSDAAPKKSVWLGRRIKVITETVQHKEIAPEHIGERDMAADSCTKYVKHEVWARHMHYILNLPGDPPDCHEAGWVKVAPSKNKSKVKPQLGSKA